MSVPPSTVKGAMAKARELGAATVTRVIVRMWAVGFPSPDAGHALVAWLDANDVPNLGYRPADPAARSPLLRADNVVFG